MTPRRRSPRLLGGCVLVAVSLAGALGVHGCADDGVRPVVPDTTPPAIQVVSPVDTAYDLDGDKLLDLQIIWSDSGGPVDLASVRVRSLRGLNGTADSSTNLLSVWRVERLDSAGLLVRETLDDLLHGGVNQIELVVSDTAGNETTDTISFAVPHGEFVTTITTGLGGFVPAQGLALCPGDGLLYMTAQRSVVVIDPDSLTVLALVVHSGAADFLKKALCVEGDPNLYVTETVERFDRGSRQWQTRATGSFSSIAIAQSRADPNLIYVGESNSGTVGVIDRLQAARIGGLLPGSPGEFVNDLAVLAGDTKLYATRFVEGGILVIDPGRDSVLGQIRVGGDIWPGPGRTDNMVLRRDDQRLYAAVIEGLVRGVVEIDTQSDTVLRNLPLFNYFAIDLALSPSEARLFVSTQDNGPPSQNVLVDVPAWRVLQTFPRVRPAGTERYDGDIVFHPSGKRLYVVHNLDVDVYLNRE